MQKGTQLILKGLAVLSLLYFTGYLLWGFLGVHDVADPHGLNVNNGTMLDHSPEPPQGSVVLLTALTANKLDVFNGIDDFYGKVWTNRQQYARLHGNLTFALANKFRLRSDDSRFKQFSNFEREACRMGQVTGDHARYGNTSIGRVGLVAGYRRAYHDLEYRSIRPSPQSGSIKNATSRRECPDCRSGDSWSELYRLDHGRGTNILWYD